MNLLCTFTFMCPLDNILGYRNSYSLLDQVVNYDPSHTVVLALKDHQNGLLEIALVCFRKQEV